MINFKTSVIAHRGASAYAPENTMASFKKALDMGCPYIEFDVMLSLDGVPFVFHDDDLKRITRIKGDFASKSSFEIQGLDAGNWFSKHFSGEPIPTLRHVLEWIMTHDIQANIEIKPTKGKTKETATTVLSDINQLWPQDKPMPILSSFDHEALSICRQLSPEVPIGLLLDSWQKNWLDVAKELDCYSIHLDKKLVTKTRIEEIKKNGYKIFVYTVNRSRKANKLLKLGVDAVFSDYPDILAP